VLTNGTLLTRADVRRDLAAADIVVPSLDAVAGPLFRRVNRPHASLDNRRVVDGLARFRDEFKGEIRLEVMLAKGINDSPAAVEAVRKAVARIRPDRIELNTVVRPPADRGVRPLGPAALASVRGRLGPRAEVVASFARRKQAPGEGDLEQALLATVGRRPQTAEDIAVALGRHRDEVLKALSHLLADRRVRRRIHGGKGYFSAARPGA
jgi:wyosine [tRNA(Phe)-imidazoG37] synthetase (radical SAM superfamily)